MARSFSFLVGIALIASLALERPDHRLVAIIVVTSLGIVLAFAYLIRGRGVVNPFSFALLATVALTVVGGTVFVLSYLTPLGALALAAALTGAATYATAKRNRVREYRRSNGLCMRCGYDLRESPDRCPECGADIPDDLARRRRIRETTPPTMTSETDGPI